MGIILSMALMPVCKGTDTLWRSMMPGASASTGRVSVVAMGPLPSMGSPKAFTTRPSMASPTGTDSTLPVRRTAVPSRTSFWSESRATDTVSSSRFWAMP